MLQKWSISAVARAQENKEFNRTEDAIHFSTPYKYMYT
jgi:hypothetical protein